RQYSLKAGYLVRSVKLSNVGPGQYLDRRRPGNLRCCRQFLKFCACEGIKAIK
uniref:Transposase n=1 Tax=Loa loa TaxID=7209 RepID=A0A1I7VCD8_LOALO